MTKKLLTQCDECGKTLGDYGWLDVAIYKGGPYRETTCEYEKQFCNYKCLAKWSGK